MVRVAAGPVQTPVYLVAVFRAGVKEVVAEAMLPNESRACTVTALEQALATTDWPVPPKNTSWVALPAIMVSGPVKVAGVREVLLVMERAVTAAMVYLK